VRALYAAFSIASTCGHGSANRARRSHGRRGGKDG
jgi:hypothetical protein